MDPDSRPGETRVGLVRYLDGKGNPLLRAVCSCGSTLNLESTGRGSAYAEAREHGWNAALGYCPDCLLEAKVLL